MLNIVFIVIGVLLIVVVGILVFAATKPDAFRIERAASIKAPPDKIFAHIDDFHNWRSWSPWENIDPALKRTYRGPEHGKGAGYGWEGNDKVGTGSMEITETLPPFKVIIKLDFLKPFEAHNIAEFTLKPQGDSTTVTWAMHGRRPYMLKVMCLFFSMDNMVGKDFDKGLASLKTIAEE
jgi:hypothetical protein